MSEAFSYLQDTLRKVKHGIGVDYSHPHGVKIGTKTYPTFGKLLHLDDPGKSTGLYGTFRIPLENGLHVRGGLSEQGELNLSVMAPIIHQTKQGKTYYDHQHTVSPTELVQFGSFGKYGENKDNYNVTFTNYSNQSNEESWTIKESKHKNPHDAIAHFSKLPYHGFATSDGYMQGGGYRNLNNEELTEHKKNFKIEPHEFPKNIQFIYSHPVHGNFKAYNYDVLTEQLREQ